MSYVLLSHYPSEFSLKSVIVAYNPSLVSSLDLGRGGLRLDLGTNSTVAYGSSSSSG